MAQALSRARQLSVPPSAPLFLLQLAVPPSAASAAPAWRLREAHHSAGASPHGWESQPATLLRSCAHRLQTAARQLLSCFLLRAESYHDGPHSAWPPRHSSRSPRPSAACDRHTYRHGSAQHERTSKQRVCAVGWAYGHGPAVLSSPRRTSRHVSQRRSGVRAIVAQNFAARSRAREISRSNSLKSMLLSMAFFAGSLTVMTLGWYGGLCHVHLGSVQEKVRQEDAW